MMHAEGQPSDLKLQCVEPVAERVNPLRVLTLAAVNPHEVTDLTVFLQEAAADLHLLTQGGCRVCEREAGRV